MEQDQKVTTSRHKIRGLMAELVVVFVGVYLAFWLNVYQQEQHDQKAKVAFCESVLAELIVISRGIAKPLNEQASDALNHLNEHGSKDFQPPLLFFDSESLLIKSAVDPIRFDAIGNDLAVNLALGHNGITSLKNRVDTFRDLCVRDIIGTDGNMRKQQLLSYERLLHEIIDGSGSLITAIEDHALPDLRLQIAQLKGEWSSL